MCGIAGRLVAGTNPAAPPASDAVVADALDRMLGVMRHRGPDDDGQWTSDDGRVWLGHRRLAIIDVEGGHQPLANEDGSIQVTFNGCIYNYLELGQLLRQKGHRFRTHCDTEVIVHAYEEFGDACVDHFNGMFAFAIWDANRRRLFAARDRLGIKPFYFHHRPGRALLFASEPKALLATGHVQAEPDRESLAEYVVLQTVLNDRTMFRGVRKLEPGRRLVYEPADDRLSVDRYWDVDYAVDEGLDEAYFVDTLLSIVEDAVRIRLRSDVPLGAHLSGGLDSSTIVALAGRLLREVGPIKTFTGAFAEGDAFDETRYAKLMAEAAGSEYLEVYPTAGDFIDDYRQIIRAMDEPAAGPGVFPQWCVCRLAHEHVKVVLGGQGGDEIFSGYARYLVCYLEECLKGAIEETVHTARYAATLQTIIPNLPMLKQYVPMLQYFWREGLFDPPRDRYWRLMDRSAGAWDLYEPDVLAPAEAIRERFGAIFDGSNAKSLVNRMQYFDLKVHLPALLHVEDRTSMAFGLESRVPLLDHRIVELVATAPPTIKFRGGEPKSLFRKAVRNVVPREIHQRKDKQGFPVPLDLWYRGPIRDFVGEILLGDRARRRGIFRPDALARAIETEQSFGRVVWGALCLETWFQEVIGS